MLAPSIRPDLKRTLAVGRQERLIAIDKNVTSNSVIDDNDGTGSVVSGGTGGTVGRSSANEDVEPADRHVYSSPAEVVRKVGSQLSGGFRRTFDVQADLVSLGILSEKTARDLVLEFVRRRKNTLLLNSEIDLAPRNRDLRHASPFLHDACCLHAMRFSEHSSSVLHRRVFEHVRLQLGQLMIASPLPLEELMGILIMSLWACSPSSPDWAATTGRPATVPSAYLAQCKLLLNFEEVTMRDAMMYAEITLYLILQDKFSQRSYLGADGECEELAAWKLRWNYLFELPAASTLRISHSIAWLILARRSLEHDQASSDDDSLSSSPRLQPADAVRQEPPAHQNPELHDLAHARVCGFATEVVRAFVEMPSTRAEELPEFHRLCVAYAMLIISKYEQKPPYGGVDSGNNGGSHEVLQLLKAAQKQNSVWSASSPSAIQFGLERALKKVTARVEGTGGPNVASVAAAAATPTTAIVTDNRAPHRIAMASPSSLREQQVAAGGTPAAWGQHHQDARGQQQQPPPHPQQDHPSSFSGTTMVPEFDGSFSLEMIDNFFNGGHLSLGDPSLF
ncbi:C6 zinc finger domain protein [Colletotrichum chrysophilum]|uniref:C6 zinc finger domain protein n=1 Tax=Colletotrichum chrysophilum TaxID=1836956 RepID=A0AAD9A037_9PEZI|nr:C6 zinc finger domain protein [Colletotrichum chrysophilum]